MQDQHEAAKRRLVARVRELAASDDLRAACDEAKRLQQEWRTIGAAAPKADRKLWQDFRGACDALFGRRDEAVKVRQAEFDASVQQAEALIAACEKLAGDEAHRLAAEVAELEEAFQALTLPREKSTELRRRFNEARRRFEQVSRERAESARAEQRESVVRAWEEKAAEPGTVPDAKAEQLLLDLEILLELPSPAPLQDARRERQMQRLQAKGLGRRNDETRQLLSELLQTPPVKSDHLRELSARLRQVLQKSEG